MATHAFETLLHQAWPITDWQDLTVLVAVSGGADSVALLCGLRALRQAVPTARGELIVAHFNHQLREQADHDQRFVEQLAQRLDLSCLVGSPDTPLAQPGQWAGEADARQARYDFLRQMARAVGARFVVTAHTADDQAETVLHHVLRGTGLHGLAGMSRARQMVDGVALLRPLLGIRRALLREYLRELSQEFTEDVTNEDPRYTRNRLRAELIPKLAADYNPRVVESLLRLGTLAGEAQASVEQWAAELAASCVTRMADDQLQILAAPLVSRPRHMAREVLMTAWRGMGWPLQAMGFEEWEQLAEMLLTPPLPSPTAPVVRVFPGGVQAKKPGESLVLTRLA